MHFHDPQYLWLLLAIPLYMWILFALRARGTYTLPTHNTLMQAYKKSALRFYPILHHMLVLLIIAVSVYALARPQSTHEEQKISKRGIDIVVALDVSDSMRAQDIRPNRLEGAKRALKHFITKRANDRIGIVVFAGAPFTQSPLTFDYDILTEYVDDISTTSITQGSFGVSGTAIGDAILSALNRLKKGESKDRTKVIVLISDGDANVGADPILAAQKAREEGVRIYTIGVGAEGGAPIPVTDAWGRKDVARNRDGSVYMATFNPSTLKSIARITGGTFFRVDDATAFQKALDEINALEKTDITVSKQVLYSDAFDAPLVTAGLLLLLFILFEYTYRIPRAINKRV